MTKNIEFLNYIILKPKTKIRHKATKELFSELSIFLLRNSCHIQNQNLFFFKACVLSILHVIQLNVNAYLVPSFFLWMKHRGEIEMESVQRVEKEISLLIN